MLSLSRAVMGLEPGDSRRVDVLDGNRLNARRSNLSVRKREEEGNVASEPNLRLPRKLAVMLRYYTRRKEMRMLRLLEGASSVEIRKKQIRIGFDEGTEVATEGRLLATITFLKDRFNQDFGFTGKVFTFVSKSAHEPPPVITPMASKEDNSDSKNDLSNTTTQHAARQPVSHTKGRRGLEVRCAADASDAEKQLFLDTLKAMLANSGSELLVTVSFTT